MLRGPGVQRPWWVELVREASHAGEAQVDLEGVSLVHRAKGSLTSEHEPVGWPCSEQMLETGA